MRKLFTFLFVVTLLTLVSCEQEDNPVVYGRDYIDDGHFFGYDETGDSIIIEFNFNTNNGRCNIHYGAEYDDANGRHLISGFGIIPEYDIVQTSGNIFDIILDLRCGETATMSVFTTQYGIYVRRVDFNGECDKRKVIPVEKCEHFHININKMVGTTLLKEID